MADGEIKPKGKVAGFFHIDRRTWKMLCGRNDMHQVAAYLTIANGTGSGNRFSSWSAQSVETHTGLHSSRAKLAIQALVASGYLKHTENSKRTRPSYELQPFEIAHETAMSEAAAASAYTHASVVRSTSKTSGRSKSENRDLAEYVFRGLAWPVGNSYSLQPASPEAGSELIWLPNTLVTGTANGEPSPLKRLRSSGDLWALRLLVDLYHAQNLSADGGISRMALRGHYKKKRYGERGRHIIWGFLDPEGDSATAQSHPATKAFWEYASRSGSYVSEENTIWKAIGTLTRMGLLTCVPHLVENDKADCEPIHGCGWNGRGEDIEIELARAASAAGEYMLGEERLHTAENVDGVSILVPVWDTQPEVQMVGIYRLTYRPQTSLTSDWMRRLAENAQEWQSTYERLGPPSMRSTGTMS